METGSAVNKLRDEFFQAPSERACGQFHVRALNSAHAVLLDCEVIQLVGVR